MAKRGQGKSVTWLRQHAAYQGDDCLVFPFYRNAWTGYGTFGYNGNQLYAHRFMCQLIHGPSPDDKPACRHLCGNGHLGCVNPKHLVWDTHSENHKDRRKHGTLLSGGYGSRSPLSAEKIAEIRALKGKETQIETAKRFGVSRPTIHRWQRTTHDPAKPGTSYSTLLRRRTGRVKNTLFA